MPRRISSGEKAKQPAKRAEISSAEESEEENAFSKYVENVQIEGLTLYEINREPRKVYPGSQQVTSPLRPLNHEFTCPVCRSMLRETLVVKECLHRFCSECIQRCLRTPSCKKECPSCRIHVPSRRSLRSDAAFDRLIALVHPDLDAYEKKEDKRIEEFNRMHNYHNAFTETFLRGTSEQLEQRRRKRNSNAGPYNQTGAEEGKETTGSFSNSESEAEEDNSPSSSRKRKHSASDDANPNEAQCVSPQLPDDEIYFVLRRHPLEQQIQRQLTREYLCTSSRFTIYHVKKFLSQKLRHKDVEDFQILIPHEGAAIILENDLCLQDIRQHFACAIPGFELILYFRLTPHLFSQFRP